MDISGVPAKAYARSRGMESHPPGPRIPDLDIIFNCGAEGSFGIAFTIAYGRTFYQSSPSLAIGYASAHGLFGNVETWTGDVTAWAKASGVMIVEAIRQNWVKWSDIGNLDFTIGITNIAGERPMEWSGVVYEIRKLGNNLVIYGANGISIMTPHDVSFGLSELSPIGLKGRFAIDGTELVHFFINSLGDLYKYDSKLTNLGYREFLISLEDPIINLDPSTDLLYICDGNLGFVYSTVTNSFGKGPVNITGIGYRDRTSYIAAPESVSIPAFEVWTDILDMGTRYAKVIYSIGFGTDVLEDLEASIEFRVDKRAAFIRIPWVPVNPHGIAYITCHGIEFRIGVRTATYTYLELDTITIDGRIT